MWITRRRFEEQQRRTSELEQRLIAANTSLEWMRARLNVCEAERTEFLRRLLPQTVVAPSFIEQINPAAFAATLPPAAGTGRPLVGDAEIDDEQELTPERLRDAQRALRTTIAEAQVNSNYFDDVGDARAAGMGLGYEDDGRVVATR